jgi:hypothetical protein
MTSLTKRSLEYLLIAILGGAAGAGAQDDGLPAEAPFTIDQEYARIAEQVPGFGGLYLDERGTTHVYLQDLSRAREVYGLGERVEVHQGDYDFRDLYAWKSEVRELLSRPGMVSLDIDETRNRLVIAAEPAYVERIQRELRDLLRPTSVPVAAVLVDAGRPVEELVDLRDKFRPVPGGVQIRNQNGGQCTHGVNATRANTRGFVTNSHCTTVRSQVEGTIFFQHSTDAENRVGVETVDPAFFMTGDCPNNFRCRYSDSAFVAYDDPGLSAGGKIANPMFCSTQAGTVDVSPVLPRVPITGFTISSPASGTVLYKVGRSTGCTFGSLKSTCADIVVNKKVNGQSIPTDIMMLCQNTMAAIGAPGDSGSPVYRKSGNEGILMGLLWGGNTDAGRLIYSPWAFVVADLGIALQPDAP